MHIWDAFRRNSLHCLPKSLMSSAMLPKVSRMQFQRPSKEILVKSYLFISEPDTATFYPALFTAQSPMVVSFLYCQKAWLISRVKLAVPPFSCFRSIPWFNRNWNAKNWSYVKWLLILHKWSTRRKIDQLITRTRCLQIDFKVHFTARTWDLVRSMQNFTLYSMV